MTTHDFQHIWRLHRDEMIRALAISTGDGASATDAVDEAFVRALHRWHVVGDFDRPQAWIFRTARNQARSRFRRLRRDRRYAPRIARSETTDPIEPSTDLETAIAGLPDDLRTVLVLRYYLEWPIADVAEALDLSPGTVKSRTHRALTECRRLLQTPAPSRPIGRLQKGTS